MEKLIIILMFAALLCLTTFNHLAAQNQLSPVSIMERANDVTRVSGTESLSTLTIVNKNGQTRIRKMATMTRLFSNGETEKKMVHFLSPSEVKGTGFLTFDYDDEDDDKWIYLPALRKTRRIISSENAKSFMGSEFTYADMTLLNMDDYDFKLLGEDVVDGVKCFKIELVPQNDQIMDECGFSRKISFIGKSDFVVRKAVYFNLFDEKEKEMHVHSIMEVDKENHKYRLKKIEMKNLLENRSSIMEIEEIKFNPNISKEYFTTRYMERL